MQRKLLGEAVVVLVVTLTERNRDGLERNARSAVVDCFAGGDGLCAVDGAAVDGVIESLDEFGGESGDEFGGLVDELGFDVIHGNVRHAGDDAI